MAETTILASVCPRKKMSGRRLSVGNRAERGGGLTWCYGTIQNNEISGNISDYKGGGLYLCGGTIKDNTITRNWASNVGGGLDQCHGTIRNNAISGNTSVRGGGGGLHLCDGTVENNVISGNSAIASSGGALHNCGGIIRNNAIVGNTAGSDGGGLYGCDATIVNNAIADNSATGRGGGLAYCNATIRNCIVWGNTAADGTHLFDSTPPTYSCIQGWSGGENNIASEPLLLAPGHWHDSRTPDDPWDDVWIDGDYRLPMESPCIDAGDNSALDPAGLDLDGNLRIAFGRSSLTVDMGPYEYGSPSFAVNYFGLDGGFRLTWTSQPSLDYS